MSKHIRVDFNKEALIELQFIPISCGCQLVLDATSTELLEVKTCDRHTPKPGSAVGVRDDDYNRRHPRSRRHAT
jgi:hypothetical protein